MSSTFSWHAQRSYNQSINNPYNYFASYTIPDCNTNILPYNNSYLSVMCETKQQKLLYYTSGFYPADLNANPIPALHFKSTGHLSWRQYERGIPRHFVYRSAILDVNIVAAPLTAVVLSRFRCMHPFQISIQFLHARLLIYKEREKKLKYLCSSLVPPNHMHVSCTRVCCNVATSSGNKV